MLLPLQWLAPAKGLERAGMRLLQCIRNMNVHVTHQLWLASALARQSTRAAAMGVGSASWSG